MTLGIVAVCFMFITIAVRWFTIVGLRDKQTRLSEASEGSNRARSRLKMVVGQASINEREIDRLSRKIKSSERRVAKLEVELKTLRDEASQQAEMTIEKLRLAEELKKRKGAV